MSISNPRDRKERETGGPTGIALVSVSHGRGQGRSNSLQAVSESSLKMKSSAGLTAQSL